MRRAAIALLALSACGACTKAAPPERHSVLFVSLDTTRADGLSCLGGLAGLTPNLDALAAESVLYTDARTVAPLTMPAHASMWTGLYPPRHGVRDNSVVKLPRSARTVAEIARDAGFQTAAFVSSVAVDSAFGFAQGFDVYDEPERGLQLEEAHDNARNAAAVVKAALRWFHEQRDPARPFLAWIHVWDPHAPYAPFPPFLEPAHGDPYLAEIHGADFALGKLFDDLRAQGLWDDLGVVVVADHGEGRGDFGEPTHGTYLWDSTAHVPVIVRDPAKGRAGERSKERASVVDVAPTLLSAMGLSAPADLDGRSLWRARLAPERGVYMESYTGYLYNGWSPLVGWADAEGTLLWSSHPRRLDAQAVGEARAGRPLVPADEAFVAPRRRAIERVLAEARLAPDDDAADEGLRDELQGLGYTASSAVGAGLPSPFADAVRVLPCPMESVQEHAETLRAIDLVAAGKPDEGLAALQAVLAQNPNSLKALGRACDVLVREERFAEARPLLERLLAIGPEAPGVHYLMGVVLEAAGEGDSAAAHWRRALELDPRHVQSMEGLARWHAARGEEGAVEELRRRMQGTR